MPAAAIVKSPSIFNYMDSQQQLISKLLLINEVIFMI